MVVSSFDLIVDWGLTTNDSYIAISYRLPMDFHRIALETYIHKHLLGWIMLTNLNFHIVLWPSGSYLMKIVPFRES